MMLHGSVGTQVRIMHGMNFMDDWVMWPNYRDGRMQLKVKAMQLKVDMQSNIRKDDKQRTLYMFHFFL